MQKSGIPEKIFEELNHSAFDAVLLYGADNLRYVTGASLPFLAQLNQGAAALLWKKGEEPVLLVPSRLRDTFRAEGRIRNVQSCGPGQKRAESMNALVLKLVNEYGLGASRIGISEQRIPGASYTALRSLLPEVKFESCDLWIKKIRMVKTPAERELLKEVAFKTDHALSAAAHHVMVYAARPEKGLSEIIRVHCIERELDMTGYESLAIGASGFHTVEPWPEAPFFGVGGGKQLAEGELVRMEIRTSLKGYWTDAARLLVMGEPSPDQSKAYGDVCAVRDELLRVLKPGTKCSDAAARIDSFCTRESIDLIRQHGMGHGIGISPVEPPFIDPSDSTILEPGMVLVLTPAVPGPERELVRTYDTVVIGEDGAELVGWYRNWNIPYKAVRSWQHGGG